MNSTFHRFFTAGVLSVWGCVLLAICLTGRISAYLHPNYQTFPLVAGSLLVLFAVLVLIAPPAANAHGDQRSSGWNVLSSLILVAPLLLAFANTSDSFSASTVANKVYVQDFDQLPGSQRPPTGQIAGQVEVPLPDDGTSGTQSSAATTDEQYLLPKTPQGQVRAHVVDFLYATQLPEIRQQLENKTIEVIGQLMPAKTNNSNGNRYVVLRMMMTCCAADAQPIALAIEPQNKPELPDMTWVKVTGTAAFPVEGGKRTPVIQNAAFEQTEPPEDAYLY
jgi:putative membrane protein